jgi:hypothetical protein
MQAGQWTAELHQPASVAQTSDDDTGEAELVGQFRDGLVGGAVVAGEEQKLLSGRLAWIGGDALAVQSVEML